MKALTYHGPHHVRVENVPDPIIEQPDDIILRVTATAICGSDLHLYRGKIPKVQHGDIFGHEFMGEIVECGAEVKNLQKGDRVVIPFVIACGDCFFCRLQQYAACENTNAEALQKHQAFGLLLALLHDGVAGPLLIERSNNLTEQVRQFIMLSPARAWTAQDVASRLALSVPTLRRRLREESQSFRQIVEEVRMAVALSQLQSTRLPIGEIALQCGYLSSSRFTARFRKSMTRIKPLSCT